MSLNEEEEELGDLRVSCHDAPGWLPRLRASVFIINLLPYRASTLFLCATGYRNRYTRAQPARFPPQKTHRGALPHTTLELSTDTDTTDVRSSASTFTSSRRDVCSSRGAGGIR